MKRILLSIFLLLTCMGSATLAGTPVTNGQGQQQKLTVFENNDWNNTDLPVNGEYAHWYQKCELIYPADYLQGMKNNNISRMAFHTGSNKASWTATFKIYLKEVSQSSFPTENLSFTDFTDVDLVYTGQLDATGDTVWVVFDKPFYYQGGNLLVVLHLTKTGNYDSASFRSKKNMSRACIRGRNKESFDAVMPSCVDYLPKVTFCYSPAEQQELFAPTAITTSDVTHNSATIGWTSSASAWQICINNDEEHLINASTNPYILTDLEADQTYEVKVRAVSGAQESDWSNTVNIRTLYCPKEQMVNISYELEYTHPIDGMGWDGNAIAVKDKLTDEVLATWTVKRGESSDSGTLSVCLGRNICFEWIYGGSDSYPQYCSYTVYDPNGEIIFEGSNKMKNPIYYTVSVANPRPTNLTVSDISVNSAAIGWTQKGDATQWQLCINNDMDHLIAVNSNPFTLTGLEDDTNYTVMVRAYKDVDNVSNWSAPLSFTTAEICPKPTNLTSVPGSTDATLSWVGTLNSYVLQYNAWWKQGDDITPEMAFVPYTYDLHYFSGTGSIAIRHYNVTDKFWLHIDNILVTDAEGTTVYSEDFENCEGSIPTSLSTIDHDGDGYGWEVKKNEGEWRPFVDGDYGISSASWKTGKGALTPDDWLIIPDVELGGTLSFKAYGQSHDDDNFAVYVLADACMKEVPISNSTTYHATRLVNDVLYVWRVKGVRGSDQSRWASSLFVTPYDPHAIATGISEVQQATSDAWFTIDGQKLSDKPTKKGVYIQNGKKTILN